jgi:hypothetical protein
VSSSLIAKQLTYLDAELFNKIEVPEMVWWSSSDQTEQKCHNIQEMTNHFNSVSYWMRTKILEPESRKEREKRYNKFLKVAKVRNLEFILLVDLHFLAPEKTRKLQRLFGHIECVGFWTGTSPSLATVTS